MTVLEFGSYIQTIIANNPDIAEMQVVFRTFDDIDADMFAAIDHPIVSSLVDRKTHELALLDQTNLDYITPILTK